MEDNNFTPIEETVVTITGQHTDSEITDNCETRSIYLDEEPVEKLHNDLEGLQGGATNEKYHLTKAQWIAATSGDRAAINILAGDNIEIDSAYPNFTITGTVEQPNLIEGDNIEITGEYPNLTITGTTEPVERVNLIEGTNIDITGTYPNLTINSTTEEVNILAGTGVAVSGTFPNITVGLDIESKTLVSPTISPVWTLTKVDGSVYSPASSTAKNIIVDVGVRANLSATYQYPVPSSTQALPITATGNFPGGLPGSATPSTPLVVNGITANNTYTVSLVKPKSGLIIVNNQVAVATGNDTTTDSISILFRSKAYVGYSTALSLTSAQILALPNAVFAANKARTVIGVTAGAGSYTYIVYEAAFGAIANIIMDGAAPVKDAFTRLTDVVITNEAGANVTMAVYRSNSTQSFTNNSLTIS